MMDIRQTEKKIFWVFYWLLEECDSNEWRVVSVKEMKTKAKEMGWMKTKAQRKRFDKALERVRNKMLKWSK